VKRLLTGLVAVLAILGLSAQTAQASEWALLSGWRFYTSSVCMAIGDNGIEAGVIAQKWNVASGGELKITASSNCVTAGYPPSRRFTIDTFTDTSSSAPCVKRTDHNGGYLDGGADGTAVNGWWRYINNPITWANKACFSDVTARRHATSAAIGYVLGLDTLKTSAYDSRVMNFTDYSIFNIPYPDARSADLLRRVYLGNFG
jgi:hypothetical protein